MSIILPLGIQPALHHPLAAQEVVKEQFVHDLDLVREKAS